MSSEYREWLRDMAVEFLFDNNLIRDLEYCEPMQGGYIAIGEGLDWARHIFFIWNDDLDGWSYKEIYV